MSMTEARELVRRKGSVKRDPYPEIARERIKSSKLIERLQIFALADLSNPDTPKSVYMSKEQIVAAVTLLKKTVPDLQSVENTVLGDNARPIMITSVDAQL